MLNLLGQQLKSFDVNFKSTEISISSLRKGVYFLKVSFYNGSHVLTKIVKE
ncbi:T9SS type A sorting domain-containing protein [uncultured Polaribacter sp.]|uniref:T9SS type A sorting domain-containing protein n=1 Tax=uncultured Polaribacter sp. TaxID=174711 RepID=UPI00345C3E2A